MALRTMSGSWSSKGFWCQTLLWQQHLVANVKPFHELSRSTKDFRNLRRVGFCPSFVWRVAITKISAKAPSLNVFWRTSCLQGKIDDHKALKDDSMCIVYAYCIPQISYGGIVCPSSTTSYHFGGWHQVLNMRHSCSITYSFIWELWPFSFQVTSTHWALKKQKPELPVWLTSKPLNWYRIQKQTIKWESWFKESAIGKHYHA